MNGPTGFFLHWLLGYLWTSWLAVELMMLAKNLTAKSLVRLDLNLHGSGYRT